LIRTVETLLGIEFFLNCNAPPPDSTANSRTAVKHFGFAHPFD
jgi:hypothetical protein